MKVLLAFVMALVIGGCASNTAVVRTQANPDPFVGQKTYSLAPIEWRDLHVGDKPEETYLAAKSPDQRASFAGDKEVINAEFARAFAEKAADVGIQIALNGPAPFLLRPVASWVEPGYYVGVASGNAEIKMTMAITAPDGTALDVIEMHGIGAGFDTRSRLKGAGNWAGLEAAKYLRSRVAP